MHFCRRLHPLKIVEDKSYFDLLSPGSWVRVPQRQQIIFFNQDGVVRSVLMSSRVTSTGYGENQESDYVGGTVV